jgi:site-specific DNA-methyltransferase (adenine-specific)
MRNTLYYGDNLPILREYIASESVDLVYLDPPFNSNRSYNVLFKQESGHESEAQIEAFNDTWHWNQHTESVYHDLVTQGSPAVSSMIGAMREFIGDNQMMAYLVMMAVRLVELHRVLKPTGTLYLHCDPIASHYLKIVLDTIFGVENYKNEVIWQRINAKGNVQRKFGAVHDVILIYAKKLGNEMWNQVFRPLDPNYVEEMYRYVEVGTERRYRLSDITAPRSRASAGQIYDWKGYVLPASRCWVYARERMEELEAQGRIIYSKTGYPNYKRYLDENQGEKIPDVWTDINIAAGSEILGYPTQKPIALLARIIAASSNPDDVVLDPFAGCGTCIAAAQQLGRHWIGIDITHLSIALQKYRLKDAFGLEPGKDYDVIGEPADTASAAQLASEDRYQFQWWALSLVKAQPLGGDAGSKTGKKGADKGIDGIITFIDDATGKPKRVVVQVKSGHVNAATVRDLRGVVEREQAAIGVLLTLEPATQPMITEAAGAGFYQTQNWGRFPRVQILTVEGLLRGTQRLEMPAQTQTATTFKAAQKEAKQQPRPQQPGLLDES